MRPQQANRRRVRVASALLLTLGVSLLSYPFVSNALARYAQDAAIQSSDEAIAALTNAEIKRLWADARQYNEELAGDPVHDPFIPGSGYALPSGYQNALNAAGDGMMATLEIPKIGIRLPVYHGTSEEVLEKGAGHLEQTALPIGEKGCRPVITGHRGLPEAELFTRLDELVEGDTFTLHVLGESLAYRVCDIEAIAPGDMERIASVPGKDLVTLVTCTPYGVNTHRLLVTGERCPLEEANLATYDEKEVGILIAFALALAALLTASTCIHRRRTP